MKNNNKNEEKMDKRTENVGAVIHDIYAAGIDQYKKAMENGFYIEAIALMESIIGDRLGRLANYLSQSERFSHRTANGLAWELSPHRGADERLLARLESYTDYPVFSEIIEKIHGWSDSRNQAVHEMCRLPRDNKDPLFEKSYSELKETAEKGYTLFREVDNVLRHMKAEVNNNSKK